MNPTSLPVDRIEFTVIKVESNEAFSKNKTSKYFPQIDLSFDDDAVRLAQRSVLSVDSHEDPRYFVLEFGIKLEDSDDSEKFVPYEVEVVARAFLRYTGTAHEGTDRFRAVRFSGYSILYGAIREMVSTLTGRGPHGVLQLPAMNFHARAKADAENDEKSRQELLAQAASPSKATRKVAAKKKAKSLPSSGPKKSDA